MNDAVDIFDAVAREADAGQRTALCAVVAARGSAPQVPGAMACVAERGLIAGTVGGGAAEAEVIRRAQAMLAVAARTTDEEHDRASGWGMAREPGMAPVGEPACARDEDMAPPTELCTVRLDRDCGLTDGPICGGQMDVAIALFTHPGDVESLRKASDRLRAGQPATITMRVGTDAGPVEYRVNLEPAPRLVIAGAGHVGRALAAIAPGLGFHVTVMDDRREFANAERFPPPIEPIVGDIAETLRRRPVDASTYVVIVTRGHRHDQDALAAVLASPAKYIGMIGSRGKIKVVFENLLQGGAMQAQVDRVHSPIGLDIKAVTPEELAVSIAAELIAVRRAEHRKTVEGPTVVSGHAG